MKTGLEWNSMEVFDRIARYYRRRPWSIVFRVVDESIVLFGDIGSGPGHNAIAIMEAVRGARGVVVDISYNMVFRASSMASRKGLSWRLLAIQADMASLPFRDGIFDLLIYIASIHHLPSRELRVKALREAYRVLRSQGKLLMTVWARYQLYFMPKIIVNLFKKILGKIHSIGDIFFPWRCGNQDLKRYYHLYTLNELKSDLWKAGFKIVDAGIFYPIKKYLRPTKNYYAVSVKNIRGT